MSLLKRVFLNQLKNGCLLIPLPHPLQTKGPSCEWLSQSGFTGEVNNCGFTQLLVHFTLVSKIASHCSISICAKLVKPKPLKALTNGPPNSVPSYQCAIEKYIFKIWEICLWDISKWCICAQHTPLFEIVHSTL